MASPTRSRRRALLEEERDLLLRSIDDLENEHEAGDIDESDYRVLLDDYTARAAAVLRRLENDDESAAAAEAAEAEGSKSPLARVLPLVGLLLAAVIAGVVLARTVGERGVNDQLTGAIDESPRNKVIRCQQMGSTGGDLVGSLACFDEVLATDPDNGEALAYRGWYLLLTAGSLQQTADGTAENEADAVELMASGMSYLDRAIEADPTLPDPLAFRASVFDRLGESEQACADVVALIALDPPQFFVDQTGPIAQRNGC